MDQFGRATEIEEALREDALQEQAWRNATRGKSAADSAENCELCDAAIPLARRIAVPGVQLCVDCQGDLEKQGYFIHWRHR
jgi:phage/conjugal plasmid C-4 type zinc finger TraR family protein